MAVRVLCPHCSKQLGFRQAPTVGRRLLCTGCQKTFPVLSGMVQPVIVKQTVPPSPPVEPPCAPVPLPPSVLKPVAPLPTAPQEPGLPPARRNVIVAGLAIGFVLLAGTTALALALASRHDRNKNREPIADLTNTTTDRERTPSGERDRPTYTPDDQPKRDQLPPPPLRRDDDPVPVPRPRPRDNAPPPIDTTKSPERGHLPRELQAEVNSAIDRGVAFLKKEQKATGSWENNHTTGLAALPGLTLLECGVPASDPVVQKAAKFTRENSRLLNNRSTTYEVSLAVLFLDRLGDPKDRPLIRALAMRIVAGQLPEGGWSYGLPTLGTEDERKLTQFLERTRPPGLDRFVQTNRPDDRKLDFPERRPGDRSLDFPERNGSKPVEEKGGAKPVEEKGGAKPGSTIPLDGPKSPSKPESKAEPRPKPLTQDQAKKELEKLPAPLRTIPAAGEATGKVPTNNPLTSGRADNSNTQFATLALWAARRHGLPVERSIDLLSRRFRNSQRADGNWTYNTNGGHFTPAMTGCGLLGLAVGHGITADPTKKSTVKDDRIDKGLKAIGQHVGKPMGANPTQPKAKAKAARGPRSPINYYFLWTVERVGVLYQVRELDGKDWYLWGVEELLPAQEAKNGSWHQPGAYHGATRPVDTCFALLFLKRANLASDLTKRLDFMVDGKPGR